MASKPLSKYSRNDGWGPTEKTQMTNNPKTSSISWIKSFFLQWCTPVAENPQGYVLLLPWIIDGTYSYCRMVWVEYCIPETKLGSSEVESFTTELISRVCILKTLKTVCSRAQKPFAIIIQDEWEVRPCLSFIPSFYFPVELVNP